MSFTSHALKSMQLRKALRWLGHMYTFDALLSVRRLVVDVGGSVASVAAGFGDS